MKTRVRTDDSTTAPQKIRVSSAQRNSRVGARSPAAHELAPERQGVGTVFQPTRVDVESSRTEKHSPTPLQASAHFFSQIFLPGIFRRIAACDTGRHGILGRTWRNYGARNGIETPRREGAEAQRKVGKDRHSSRPPRSTSSLASLRFLLCASHHRRAAFLKSRKIKVKTWNRQRDTPMISAGRAGARRILREPFRCRTRPGTRRPISSRR
jgi:hypothetical protein